MLSAPTYATTQSVQKDTQTILNHTTESQEKLEKETENQTPIITLPPIEIHGIAPKQTHTSPSAQQKRKTKTVFIASTHKENDIPIVTLSPVEVIAIPVKLFPHQEKIIDNFTAHIHDFSREELARIATHHEWYLSYLSKIFPDAEYGNTPEVQRELVFHATIQEHARQALDETYASE